MNANSKVLTNVERILKVVSHDRGVKLLAEMTVKDSAEVNGTNVYRGKHPIQGNMILVLNIDGSAVYFQDA